MYQRKKKSQISPDLTLRTSVLQHTEVNRCILIIKIHIFVSGGSWHVSMWIQMLPSTGRMRTLLNLFTVQPFSTVGGLAVINCAKCLYGALWQTGVPSRVYFWPMTSIPGISSAFTATGDKVVTGSETVSKCSVLGCYKHSFVQPDLVHLNYQRN